jgi:hypothetical protein
MNQLRNYIYCCATWSYREHTGIIAQEKVVEQISEYERNYQLQRNHCNWKIEVEKITTMKKNTTEQAL